ncbi:MAG: hypothetical protein JSV80_07720, partial [Acidobacteriota bacterium]
MPRESASAVVRPLCVRPSRVPLALLLAGLLMLLPALAFQREHTPSRFEHLAKPAAGGVIGLRARSLETLPEGDPLRGGWGQFSAQQARPWRVWINARSGLPSLAYGGGIAWMPGPGNSLPAGPLPTIEQLAETAEQFLREHPMLLGRWGGQLELDLEASGSVDERLYRITFRQVVEGVRVQGARYDFFVTQGNLVSFGATSWAPVRRGVVPAVSVGDARRAVDEYLGITRPG